MGCYGDPHCWLNIYDINEARVWQEKPDETFSSKFGVNERVSILSAWGHTITADVERWGQNGERIYALYFDGEEVITDWHEVTTVETEHITLMASQSPCSSLACKGYNIYVDDHPDNQGAMVDVLQEQSLIE